MDDIPAVVDLTRALVSNPRLVVLDEPLGALDALTRLTTQHLIRDVDQLASFTAILVTHNVTEAVALSDRVIVLGQGASCTASLSCTSPRRLAAGQNWPGSRSKLSPLSLPLTLSRRHLRAVWENILRLKA